MIFRLSFILIASLMLTSCSTFFYEQYNNRQIVSSSLSDFLYPNQEEQVEHKPEIPVLNLPITVGVAFIPLKSYSDLAINQAEEIRLLKRVKQSFANYPFIERIEVIPNIYLKNGEGFSALQQVSRLYDVDVMALVSYDQVSKTYENTASIFYWTIVGMYVIPGNDNVTQTFVDTAVFDVKSKKMLFRAPGINRMQENTTAAKIEKNKIDESRKSFDLAVTDMIVNLDIELANFRQRVEKEKIVEIKHKSYYRGGGSLGLTLLCLLIFLIFSRRLSHFTSGKG